MSINIYGTLLVSSEMTQEQIDILKKTIDESGLSMELSVNRDVERDVHYMFQPKPEKVKSLGIKMPDIHVDYWCDTGGEPFFWNDGFEKACSLVRSLNYKAVKNREIYQLVECSEQDGNPE